MKCITFSTIKSATVFSALLVTSLAASLAQADTLLVERVKVEQGMALPARGSSMAQVEARFGAPAQKFAAVAGPNDRKHNPPITRWAYPTFRVYFENNHVIDAVVNQASPTEMGPAPAQK